MITIETKKPVYANLGGKSPEQKKASRQRFLDKSRGIYSKGKESGILSGLENLFLGGAKPSPEMYSGDQLPVDDKPKNAPMNPTLKWGLIIGGVAVVGTAIWYFGFRNKK